ncbi:MAG: GAF domain-containing protein [Deltaproteobacteria bacterium]|nr:GAF domain-containing protein [Deltaproteobacteria bacterium]
MERDTLILKALMAINGISRDRRLAFNDKLEKILREIVRCMKAKSGSIMLIKGRKNLEVAASTKPELVGVRQSLEEESPSSWVVRHKKPLRVDDIHRSRRFHKRFDRYRGAAFLLVPIIVDEKVIGVLSVTDKLGDDIFSAAEQEGLLCLAGQVIGALENQRLAESLKKKGRILQQKNRELRKLERLKTDLYNMMIHDLKGPISEIVANLDILSYTLNGENLEFVRAAQSGCDTLYRMVSNLLDISRIEEGKLQLVYERIDPRDIFKEAVARVFGLTKSKDLRVQEDIPESDSREFLWADRDILLRILQNLLSNAIQYSPAGETIEAGFHFPDKSKIEFYVKDNGPGIPPKYQESIFDKYHQLKRETGTRLYTTGLGLTFCRMAVEAHRGSIRVISDGKQGSTFTFTLPLQPKSVR